MGWFIQLCNKIAFFNEEYDVLHKAFCSVPSRSLTLLEGVGYVDIQYVMFSCYMVRTIVINSLSTDNSGPSRLLINRKIAVLKVTRWFINGYKIHAALHIMLSVVIICFVEFTVYRWGICSAASAQCQEAIVEPFTNFFSTSFNSRSTI